MKNYTASHTILYSALLYSTILYGAILHYAPLCHVMLCSALHCTLLYSILLYSTVVHYTMLNHTRLYYAYALKRTLGNYPITCIGKTTQHILMELPECISETSKIPPEPPPKASKMRPKSTLGLSLEPDLKKTP